MRLIKSCCIALFLAMCLFAVKASASSLSAGEGLSLSSVSNEDSSFMLSKVYFLPDWRESDVSFGNDDSKPCTEVCNNVSASDCAYGLTETYVNSCGETCVRCKECVGCESQGYRLSACPENGICANDCCNKLYKLTDCGEGFIKDGDSCRTESCTDDASICTGGKTCQSGVCKCPSGKTEVNGQCETSTCANGGVTCSSGVCDTSSGECVECLSKGDCSSGVCDTGSKTCVECLTNSDCTGGKECSNKKCVVPDPCAGITCSGGKSCVDGTCKCPSGQIDNGGTCEAPNCANGGIDCEKHGKVCNTSSGECVECTQDSHCSGNMTCQNNSCTCPSDKPNKNSSGQCVQCTSDSHCGDNEKCNTSSNSCEAAQEYCVTGSIYYSDGTCSTAYNSEKTPLGVVVNPEFHLIVGLKNLTGPIVHGTNGFKNVGNEPVDNYSERGYENTQKIYELIKNTDRTTIISFCWEATSSALAGGRMYVPATAEASLIAKNITKINNTLMMLSQYRTDTLPVPGTIWTSDEAELGAPVTMLAYDITADTALEGILKYDSGMYGRCVGRYKTDPFWGETIKPSVDGMGNSYMTYPLEGSCRGSYFRDVFYWNPEYNRCVYDYELEAGGGEEPGPSLPSCEEWEENGWLNASTSYNSSVCRSYNESIQECQYKDGSKGKFCDLSTNCTFGAEAYRTYKYCPNGARCMYNSCQYYQNMSASESPRRLGRNKNCYTCIQSTNESCGTRQNFVQCK